MVQGILMAIGFAMLRSALAASCTQMPGNFQAPISVLWIRALFLPPTMRGNAVEPAGVILILGIDREPQTGEFGFLDEHFGENASQEFEKQAILFNRGFAPPVLQHLIPFHTSFLFAIWHCTLETGSWCTRWSSFVSQLKAEEDFNSKGAPTILKWQAGDGETPSICLRETEETTKPRFEVEQLERTLVGSGSHREIHTRVSLKPSESTQAIEKSSCELVLVEFLPNTLFADAFQLHRLTSLGRYNLAEVYGDTDLERPAEFSRQAIVELHSPLSEDSTLLSAQVSLPLHVRYVPLSLTSHYLVNLSTPLLLVRSGDWVERVVWVENPTQEQQQQGRMLLQWRVPAGNAEHRSLVTLATALAALMGAAALLFVTCAGRNPSSKDPIEAR